MRRLSVGIDLIAMGEGPAGRVSASGPASVASKRSGHGSARAWPGRAAPQAAKHFGWGVRQKRMPNFNSPGHQHSAPEVTDERRGLLVQHLPWSGQQEEEVAKTFVIDQIPPYPRGNLVYRPREGTRGDRGPFITRHIGLSTHSALGIYPALLTHRTLEGLVHTPWYA